MENGLENNVVALGKKVGDVGVFVDKYLNREESVFGKFGFIDDEETKIEDFNDYRNESMPAVPGIHNTAPGDSYKEGR